MKRVTGFIEIAAILAFWSGSAWAGVEYDFTYVDAFQPDYDLRESYLFDINNQGVGCGWATDLPSYAGYSWSNPAGKVRLPFTYARGINGAGQIVGLDQVFDTVTETATTMPRAPGAVATPVALDINDHGVVVGYDETCLCSNSNHLLQIPFVWDAHGGSRSIPVPGAKELVKINNHDVAVGNIRGGSPDGFVFDLNAGRTVVLSAFFPSNPYPWTEAADINNFGMVSGTHRSDDAQSYHGFVWTEAAGATLLPHLNGLAALSVRPWALNDDGVVVGTAEISQHVWRAFTWDAAHGIRDLNALATLPPDFILDRAIGINDRGWIVGDGHFGPNWSSSQAFVLVPRVEVPLAVQPPGADVLRLRVLPNPVRDRATIEYAIAAPGAARISIFDVGGRNIATIVESGSTAMRQVSWDGRDATGRPVPAGAYVIRLESASGSIARRLAIVR